MVESLGLQELFNVSVSVVVRIAGVMLFEVGDFQIKGDSVHAFRIPSLLPPNQAPPSPRSSLHLSAPGSLGLWNKMRRRVAGARKRRHVKPMEIVFSITQEADGGFVGECLSHDIFTQGDTWVQLRANVQEATSAFFFDAPKPSAIRLHLVKDELLAFA